MANISRKAPVFYIPHGGGPLPLLHDSGHDALVAWLKYLPTTYQKPEAIIVVSAHWEEERITITGASKPQLIYDYFGFPEQAYDIQYPASGAPKLASAIHNLLEQNGIASVIDDERGFDHGMFVPLKLMYPEADIPCVQVSLNRALDPQLHIAAGKAISALRQQNVLILGSGFSFHNMRAFSGAQKQDNNNIAFETWLIETLTSDNTSYRQKEEMLVEWLKAPFARYCHPREEHLLPLHLCFGAGLTTAELVFEGMVIGKKASAFRW